MVSRLQPRACHRATARSMSAVPTEARTTSHSSSHSKKRSTVLERERIVCSDHPRNRRNAQHTPLSLGACKDARTDRPTLTGKRSLMGNDVGRSDGLPRCRSPAGRTRRHQGQPQETRCQARQPGNRAEPRTTSIQTDSIPPRPLAAVAEREIRCSSRNVENGPRQVAGGYRHAACSCGSRRRQAAARVVGQSSLVRLGPRTGMGIALLATP